MLIEVVDRGNRDFFAAHTAPGTRQPEPIRVARRAHREDVAAAAPALEEKAGMDIEGMKQFFASAGTVTYCPGG